MKSIRSVLALGSAILLLGVLSPAALAHPGQHGTTEGHLIGTGEWGKIDFLGQVTVADAEEGLIADVAVDPDGDYAYLARWVARSAPAQRVTGRMVASTSSTSLTWRIRKRSGSSALIRTR